MDLHDYHRLAHLGIALYAINRDPLTASAATILLQARELPLTPPQGQAVLTLQIQMEGYNAVHTEPLDAPWTRTTPQSPSS